MKYAFASVPSSSRFVAFSMVLVFAGLAACSTTPASDAAAGSPAAGQSSADAPAAPPGAASGMFTGKVVETMNSGGYTYVRLQADQQDVWVAADEFPVKEGESLTVALEMPMANFHSDTLDRDFPVIYFVAQVAREGQVLGASPGASGVPAPMSSHDSAGAPAPAGSVAVQPNAPPSGGLSIADTWAKRASLSGKQVSVRGTVVKVNNNIMGVNWFHLQDGSGEAEDGTNDLTVTSDAVVNVGDVVTVSGTLATKKDFGAGYSYEAILEKATIK